MPTFASRFIQSTCASASYSLSNIVFKQIYSIDNKDWWIGASETASDALSAQSWLGGGLIDVGGRGKQGGNLGVSLNEGDEHCIRVDTRGGGSEGRIMDTDCDKVYFGVCTDAPPCCFPRGEFAFSSGQVLNV